MRERPIGFNFLWLFTRSEGGSAHAVDLRALDFVAGHGFTTIRLPIDYRFLLDPADLRTALPDGWGRLDEAVAACEQRGLECMINLHRAPGYCVAYKDPEPSRLWRDEAAQDAFVDLWCTIARRYHGRMPESLALNLVNEPAGSSRERPGHDAVMRRAAAAIRGIDPQRAMILDGWDWGNQPLPELADLGVEQSCRGYLPGIVSHYRAHWRPDLDGLPEPQWPGVAEDGARWDRDTLAAHYAPWHAMQTGGVGVHVGEFGCYSFTPDPVARAWLADLIALYRSYGWGALLWNFRGGFGIVEHGRPGATYETLDGYQVDRWLMEQLLSLKE